MTRNVSKWILYWSNLLEMWNCTCNWKHWCRVPDTRPHYDHRTLHFLSVYKHRSIAGKSNNSTTRIVWTVVRTIENEHVYVKIMMTKKIGYETEKFDERIISVVNRRPVQLTARSKAIVCCLRALNQPPLSCLVVINWRTKSVLMSRHVYAAVRRQKRIRSNKS